jgi:hypothetical protein
MRLLLRLAHVGFIAFVSHGALAEPDAPQASSESLSKYDVEDQSTTLAFVLEVTGADLSDVKGYLSNRTDDTTCDHALVYMPGLRRISSHSLSRLGAPERALYEWHLCFEIDGKRYLGWRGFDPGPSSRIELACKVEGLDPPSERYACEVAELFINPEIYATYAHSCSQVEGKCRAFETKSSYIRWKQQPELTKVDRLEIAAAILRQQLSDDSYLHANPMDYYVTVEGEDLPESFLAPFSTSAIKVFPDSMKGQRHGMSMSIGSFFRMYDGRVKVSLTYYCGPLCASGHTIIVERRKEDWHVVSSEMNWIS